MYRFFEKIKKIHWIIVLFGIILAVLYSAYSFYTFSIQSEQLTKDAKEQQLEEIAHQTANSIRELSLGLSGYIKASTKAFSNYDDLLSKESLETLQSINDHSRFDRIRIVLDDYYSYGEDGDRVDIAGAFIPATAFSQEVDGVSHVFESPLTKQNMILFYSPIVNQNNEITGVLAGTYEVGTLSNSTTIKSFSGEGFAEIIEPNGSYIISSGNRYFAFKYLDTVTFLDEGNLKDLEEGIKAGRSGLIKYNDKGVVYYTYYLPAEVNGWYILQTAPETVIASQTGYIQEISLALLLKSIGFFSVVIVSIWIVRHYSQRNMRALRTLLNSVVNAVPGGVIKCSGEGPDFDFDYISDGFLSLIGCTREDYLESGLTNGLMDSVFFEDKDRIRNLLTTQENNTTLQLEYRIVTVTGETVWVVNNCTRVKEKESDKPCIFAVCIDNSESRKISHSLHISNERLKTAMSQNPNIIFEYDPETHKIVFLSKYSAYFDLPPSLDNGPSYMVKNKIVDSNCAERFLRCFDSLTDPNTNMTSMVLRLRRADGNLVWHKMTVSSVFDIYEQKKRSIGIFVDISLAKEAMSRHKVEKKYRAAMLADAISTFEIDLTANSYSSTDYKTRSNISEQVDYSNHIKSIANKYIYPDDRKLFMKTYDRQNLINEYESGKTILYDEFRQIDDSGNTYWTSYSLNLLTEPETEHLKAIGYIKDIDKKKRAELAIKFTSERDSLTGLYNRRAALALISDYLKTADSKNSLSGFLTLDLDCLKTINDTYGHLTGDEMLIEIAQYISSFFRETDIIARMGGDEFVIFIKNVQNRTDIYARAVKTCESIKNLRVGEHNDASTTVSIGISLYPNHGKSFEELYKTSDIALYKAKRAGKDRCVLYDPQDK